MAVTVNPATLEDMAEHPSANSWNNWRVVQEMLFGGQAFAAFAGDSLVALGGIHPSADGTGETWFALLPNASNHICSILLQARLTLAAAPYSRLAIPAPSAAGRRMAMMLGFSGHCLVDDRNEIWILELKNG